MTFSRTWQLSVALVMFCTAVTAQSLRDLKKQAENFMAQGLKWEALSTLEACIAQRPGDVEIMTLLAEAQIQTNQYAEALATYTEVLNSSKKVDLNIHIGHAKALHLNARFSEGITNYKTILSQLDEKDPRRSKVVQGIKECAVGLRYVDVPSDDAVVENMGNAVNSQFDEIMPVESPNFSSRMYFSSGRHLRFVDEFDKQGNLTTSRKQRDFDMLASEIINGAWSAAVPLNVSLNSDADELLFDFTGNGQVAVFARHIAGSYVPYVDTFNVNTFDELGVRWNSSPNLGDGFPQGLHFFNDSTAIFSSADHGGFGGYDIFMTERSAGTWKVTNLGPKVNSSHDEISPFLALDGRTVYFSANGQGTMGAFDIFRITFDDRTQDWTKPQNLGMPINSPANDLFFRLTQNGSSAFYASDRAGSKGGFDLYSVYYSAPQREQVTRSIPILFNQVADFTLFNENLAGDGSTAQLSNVKKDQFTMPALYFRDNNRVITPQNGNKLEKIVGFVQTYPHVKLEIASHSAEEPVSNFDLFSSLKRAEQIQSYLQQQGVKSDRIVVRGYGGAYPVAKNSIEGDLNEAGQWFNRRLDVIVQNQEQLPIEIVNELPTVADRMHDVSHQLFSEATAGLFYRIHFSTLDQMYKGDLTTRYADPMIGLSPQGFYTYYTGIFDSFADALSHLTEIKSEGFSDARIVPFIQGVELSKGETSVELLAKYPDLKDYLIYIK